MSVNRRAYISAICPACEVEVFFREMPAIGQFVTCQACGDMLEVMDTSPLILDWSTYEDDDWDEVWDDDDSA